MDITRREQLLRDAEHRLADSARLIDEQVAGQVSTKLAQERTRVAADETRKAKLANAAELDAKAREVIELHEVLKLREAKLAEAQQALLSDNYTKRRCN